MRVKCKEGGLDVVQSVERIEEFVIQGVMNICSNEGVSVDFAVWLLSALR